VSPSSSSSSPEPVSAKSPHSVAVSPTAEPNSAVATTTRLVGSQSKAAAHPSTVDRRPFLEWLSEEPVASARPPGGTSANEETAVAQWVVAKHPLVWETPAHLKAGVSTTVAAPVAAQSTPAAVSPTNEPEKFQSAQDLDSDDLALLQKVLEPTGQWAAWAIPPSIQVAQAWVNEATAQATEGLSGSGGVAAGLSGQMERLLRWSAASGKSVRVVIDDSLAVILRIRQGRVSADFMPHGVQSAEVASRLAAMQNQLDELKQRLAAQNLPVDAMRARLGRPYQPPSHHNDQPSQTEDP
jgi:hypothetical protein